MRLDKLLGNLKYGSRSEIKVFCKKGLVVVNDLIIKDPSINVTESDVIYFNNELVYHKDNIYLMLNKPKGYICANKDGLHKTVLELIKEPYNRYDLIIVGRLDIDTEGLLLITNDGAWAHQVISPSNDHYKKYYVKLKNKLINYDCLLDGVEILDGNNNVYKTKKAYIEVISSNEAYISISEGKFHQVKRMFEYIGNEVLYLKRVQINSLTLDIELGKYKEIDKNSILS